MSIDSRKPVEPLLYTPAEAAKALAISERSLWSLTACRELPCIRIGRSVRYARDDLVAWIAARKSS
jgi:excisionase family DNA binding protein